MSETNTARETLGPFCIGAGLDIGFGGMKPINETAICVEQPMTAPGRASCSEYATHLICDAFKRLPFESNSLDYVYSSHCLEDAVDTESVLVEWVRVIRPGGLLVLFLPDQGAYESYCAIKGTQPNGAHKHKEFSLTFVKARLPKNVEIAHAQDTPLPHNPYSFELVLQKRAQT